MNKLTYVIFFAVLLFTACKGSDSRIQGKDKYEKGKLTLEEVEKKDPAMFLGVSGKDKRNILGQTVVKGTVYSNAKIVSFKDIDVKLSFYSKTGALLEEDHETVYETIRPGSSAQFKTKYFAPKGTDSVAMKVVGAGIGE